MVIVLKNKAKIFSWGEMCVIILQKFTLFIEQFLYYC